MIGSTNRATSEDPRLEGLSYPESAEPTLSLTAETVATEQNTHPNADPIDAPNADSWRVEVSARLERYRIRRKPRTPRYPSLLLPFDSPESWSRPAPPSGPVAIAATPAQSRHDFAFEEDPRREESAAFEATSLTETRQLSEHQPGQSRQHYSEQVPEPSAKVIEFPRSAAIPVFHASELADSIFDRPRIVEAPEIVPSPPALGGMLMEPVQQELADRRATDVPSFEASASIVRRAAAVIVDGVILAAAVVAFAAIFLRLNPSLTPVRGPVTMLVIGLGAVAVALWMAYKFLFVVYTGSTPGLRAAKLRLVRFDGLPLNRNLHRWRVLASFLSAFSAGLGYLWCFLDQDRLCWHDRITRTHLQSVPPVPE